MTISTRDSFPPRSRGVREDVFTMVCYIFGLLNAQLLGLAIFSDLWKMLRSDLGSFLIFYQTAVSNTEVIHHLLNSLNRPGFS